VFEMPRMVDVKNFGAHKAVPKSETLPDEENHLNALPSGVAWSVSC
jgi:hypothetical protein